MPETRKKNGKNVLLTIQKSKLAPGPEDGVKVAVLAPPLFLPGGLETFGSENEARWALEGCRRGGLWGGQGAGSSLCSQRTFPVCLCLRLSLSPSQSLFLFHFSLSSILNNQAKERRGKKNFFLENLRQIHSWVFLGEGVLWQDKWRGRGALRPHLNQPYDGSNPRTRN